MDNTEVAGQSIQMNLAKPKGDKGGNGQQPAESCKLFVHGVPKEAANSDLQAAFEKFGTVTDAYNTWKGFAFVTFTTPREAKAAMEGLEGQEVGGSVVSISIAKPKREAGGAGGGGGGGRRDEVGCKLF